MDDTRKEKSKERPSTERQEEYEKVLDADFNFPNSFEEFGYRFNEFGQLRHVDTHAPFEFNIRKDDPSYNQKRYEAVGELVTTYVYNLLEEEGKLKKMFLPLDASDGEPQTFIFHSEDAFVNEKVIILIHGSGVVRAGQWARRLIINDSLNSGTQLPFIKRARGLGYGVIVLNTNDNRREVNGSNQKIRGCESPENHANYVWEKLIIPKAAAKFIAIVAHSNGGIVTVNLCRTYPESFQKRVIAIAFTDSAHNLVLQGVSQSQIEWFQKVARNWVSNNLPLDTYLPPIDSYEVACYSAGTQRHDLTSWMSFTSVYEFIDKMYSEAVSTKGL